MKPKKKKVCEWSQTDAQPHSFLTQCEVLVTKDIFDKNFLSFTGTISYCPFCGKRIEEIN